MAPPAPGAGRDGYPPHMPEVGLNPFQPGRGVLPPLLAGRNAELGAADETIAKLTAGASPSEDLFFYGPRGNGKTTLLLEIGRRARERGARVETLPVDALTDAARLVRRLQERAQVLGGGVTSVQAAGFGVSGAPGAPPEDPETLLSVWVGSSGHSPLVILLDEVQAMSPEVARPFFDAVQQAKSGAAPFLVLAAGTPDAPRRLLRAGTYNERGFRFLPVGRLARKDTNAALSEPARNAGRPVAEDALALLAEESQDYPYFIQLLGSAAWKAATGPDPRIDLSAAQQGLAEFGSRSAQFYARRYEEAEFRRVESVLKPLARLFVEHEGRVSHDAFKELLHRVSNDGSIPLDDLDLWQELKDLGVVWSTAPGVWEMGIPSFADYLLRRG